MCMCMCMCMLLSGISVASEMSVVRKRSRNDRKQMGNDRLAVGLACRMNVYGRDRSRGSDLYWSPGSSAS